MSSARPGPSSQAQSPRFMLYDPNNLKQHDSDCEDDEDEEIDGLKWMNGLTAQEYYAQDAQHDLLHQGGQVGSVSNDNGAADHGMHLPAGQYD
ncbi:hypothetical protein FRC11_005166 [Ceratobasidium sp. 423]|nr:hypothetical protein FRC11_005166 [Ceratobasidium sp. 423]